MLMTTDLFIHQWIPVLLKGKWISYHIEKYAAFPLYVLKANGILCFDLYFSKNVLIDHNFIYIKFFVS